MAAEARRATSLSPHDMFMLDLACKPFVEAWGWCTYLVGSAVQGKESPRDIDVRMILDDDVYAQLVPTPEVRTVLAVVFTAYLRSVTGLPIDFGIQAITAANQLYQGYRHPLGHRTLDNWTGDAHVRQV